MLYDAGPDYIHVSRRAGEPASVRSDSYDRVSARSSIVDVAGVNEEAAKPVLGPLARRRCQPNFNFLTSVGQIDVARRLGAATDAS